MKKANNAKNEKEHYMSKSIKTNTDSVYIFSQNIEEADYEKYI